MLRGIIYNVVGFFCCGNCHSTYRNGHDTLWSQVEEIICVGKLILINMSANMWLTGDYDFC